MIGHSLSEHVETALCSGPFPVDSHPSNALAGHKDPRAVLSDALTEPWFRFCFSLLGDADRARDAVQETATRFLVRIGGFRGESQLLTWSMGIAVNVVREMRRRDRKPDVSRWTAMRVAHAGPLQAAESIEEATLLRDGLAALGERQRQAIVLRYFEDLSVEQTAAAMGCAAGTVKATVFQGLRILRRRLGDFSDPSTATHSRKHEGGLPRRGNNIRKRAARRQRPPGKSERNDAFEVQNGRQNADCDIQPSAPHTRSDYKFHCRSQK